MPWCTRDDVTDRLGTDAGRSGLDADDLDRYAAIASELLYVISGRQFPGVRDRTIRTAVGRARKPGAVASLGRWWPILSVSDVLGININGTTEAIDPADWSLTGVALTVPHRWANLRVQALLSCGQDPTPAGVEAATALAVELIIATPEFDGDQESRLPALVTSVSRQGVSQSFATTLDVLKEGATGIAEVDQFIAAYNSIKTKSRPRVRAMR